MYDKHSIQTQLHLQQRTYATEQQEVDEHTFYK